MVAFFGIIAFLTLILIFCIIKLQNAQKAINELKLQSKKTLRHANYLNSGKEILALTWQKTLLTRLHNAQKHAVISTQDASVLEVVFNGFAELLNQCLNQSDSLEESLLKYLADKEGLELQDVREIIKKQQQDVRLAWSKNNAEGLIISFTKLSERIDPLALAQQKNQAQTNAEND